MSATEPNDGENGAPSALRYPSASAVEDFAQQAYDAERSRTTVLDTKAGIVTGLIGAFALEFFLNESLGIVESIKSAFHANGQLLLDLWTRAVRIVSSGNGLVLNEALEAMDVRTILAGGVAMLCSGFIVLAFTLIVASIHVRAYYELDPCPYCNSESALKHPEDEAQVSIARRYANAWQKNVKVNDERAERYRIGCIALYIALALFVAYLFVKL